MGEKLSYTIRLDNVVVYGFHGVHPEEKTLGQRFEIDLEYRLKNPADPWKDEERSTISYVCLLYTSPSPRDRQKSRMPSSA